LPRWQRPSACCGGGPGGRLVVLTMALDEAGDFGYRPVLHAIYATLVDMVEQGFVRPEEIRRMAIPTVGRGRTELLAPFDKDGRFADLPVEQMEVFLGADRIWMEFERNRDAQKFGARWAAFSRASVFPTLAAELDGGRADPRAGEFIGRMEAGMAERLAATPEQMLIPLGKMLLAKEGG
jgi:hypothetical protein